MNTVVLEKRTGRPAVTTDHDKALDKLEAVFLRLQRELIQRESHPREETRRMGLRPGKRVEDLLVTKLNTLRWSDDIPLWASVFKRYYKDGVNHNLGWHVDGATSDEKMRIQAFVLIRLFYVLRQIEAELRCFLFSDEGTDTLEEKSILELRGWGKWYRWEAFVEAIKVKDQYQLMPDIWRRGLPSPSGLRWPFTDEDCPIEILPEEDRQSPQQLFDDQPVGIVRDSPNVHIRLAQSDIDRSGYQIWYRVPLRADQVIYTWRKDDDEFEFSDQRMIALYDYLIEKLKHGKPQRDFQNGLKARVSDYYLQSERPVFEFQPVRYWKYAVSNQLVQIGVRFKDTHDNLLDVLAPRGMRARHLPNLDVAQFSNHLGVTAIVMTADCYLLMYVRSNTDNTDPGQIGFAASKAMPFERGMRPEVYLTSSGFESELHCQGSEILPATEQQGANLLYLGTLREWIRGGKPEMYFLARSKLTLNEHVNKLKERKSSSGIHPDALWKDRDYCRLSDPGDPHRSQGDIRVLLERADYFKLQEAARGGLYLIYQAYESAKRGDNTLLSYLYQLPFHHTFN